MKLVALSACVLIFVCVAECKDLIVGTNLSNRLLWQQKVEYNAIPLKKRVKEEFYSDPGQQIIKGIIARDLDHDDSSVTITAGGVGSSFVNLRFKSERGSGLNYQVEIYA
ncbi:probable salivary secreted peptide [Plodia interpunctella]|uniref:probable salivary secreted peptide n=1 Tax=Plodia interpunctella TaxID=58824 RepID=UPI002368174C|nr:probable salivary secreted peptide [Plodia interpunctella]